VSMILQNSRGVRCVIPKGGLPAGQSNHKALFASIATRPCYRLHPVSRPNIGPEGTFLCLKVKTTQCRLYSLNSTFVPSFPDLRQSSSVSITIEHCGSIPCPSRKINPTFRDFVDRLCILQSGDRQI